MEPLIDAIFSEGFFWTVVLLAFFLGPPTGARFRARHELKAAQLKRAFELEKKKLELEQKRLNANRPICECGHGANFHDRSGACIETVQRPNQWNAEGKATGYENVPCVCLNYVGPSPGITGDILGELGELGGTR
jgi:hypothetical protein